jgi:hypothetical protein
MNYLHFAMPIKRGRIAVSEARRPAKSSYNFQRLEVESRLVSPSILPKSTADLEVHPQPGRCTKKEPKPALRNRSGDAAPRVLTSIASSMPVLKFRHHLMGVYF